MNSDNSVGFLGLGALGAPLAQNLLAAGLQLRVWNRTADKAKPLVERGASQAARPADAVPPGGVVMTILWDDASLDEVVHSDGFLANLKGGVHVSMTTISLKKSREMAALHTKHGSTYVECPVFGIPVAAVAKQMIMCTAGPGDAKARVRPLLEKAGAAKIYDFGEQVGGAIATKLSGNFMILAGMSLLQEVYDALRANDVDPKPVLEMLTTTMVPTPGNQRYVQFLMSGAPPPKSGIPLKDTGLFQSFAQGARAASPMADRLSEVLAKR